MSTIEDREVVSFPEFVYAWFNQQAQHVSAPSNCLRLLAFEPAGLELGSRLLRSGGSSICLHLR